MAVAHRRSNVVPSVCVNVGDCLRNLALLELSSIITDVVNHRPRHSNVATDVRCIRFTPMSDHSRLTASARTLYCYLAMLDFWDRPACLHAIDNVRTRQWELHLRLQSSRLPHNSICHHNGCVDGIQQLLGYGSDRTLAGRQVWYPQQVPSSPSRRGQPHRRLHLT